MYFVLAGRSTQAESSMHLFLRCHFTLCLWNLANEWLHLKNIATFTWDLERSIKDWWVDLSDK